MFGAMFIGLSGMTAYSDGLRQISNNITNLNSPGFRASTVGFNDLFRGGTGGISYSSGRSDSGDGVQLSELKLDFSQGDIRQTGRDLDLAVEGNGFLVLEKDGQYFYARTGSFEIDNDGFIVLSGTDYKLTILDESGRPTSLSIDSHRIDAPEATTKIKFSDNLSSTAASLTLPDLQVFNENGEADQWDVVFTRDAVLDEWAVKITNAAGDEVGEKTLKFINGTVDPTTSMLAFDDDKGRSVELDFSENVTSFSSGEVSTLRSTNIDGFGIGEVTSITINESGAIELGYSNEQTFELGAITLADFREPQNLEQRSGGLFTFNSSVGREFFSSVSDRVGQVQSRRIEGSNVDLSQQFGDLILVQRGYQASSQIVSVSNDMIQQLFGISGRG